MEIQYNPFFSQSYGNKIWTADHGVNLRIQSEYRKLRTAIISIFGHFLRSEIQTRIKT